MMLDLDPGRIDLWCASPDDIVDEALLQAYRRLLSEAERQQESRFHFARDRKRYLVTRALVRTVLSRYAPIAPEYWRFGANAYGRPHIAHEMGLDRRLSFNISHTDNLIVLGITREQALGVDTENLRPGRSALDLADHYFAPEEAADLRAQPAERQHQRFFEYWTLKESYIKARGMGLSIPLDHFSFRLSSDNDIQIAIHPDQNDRPARWHFWQFKLDTDHLVAVCAERGHAKTPSLVWRQVVPGVVEKAMDHQLLRASVGAPSSHTVACI